MSTSEDKQVFKQLSPIHEPLSNIVRINHYEFAAGSCDSDKGLYKYNVLSNEWALILKYPTEFKIQRRLIHICYDEKHDVIYLYGTGSRFSSIVHNSQKGYLFCRNHQQGVQRQVFLTFMVIQSGLP